MSIQACLVLKGHEPWSLPPTLASFFSQISSSVSSVDIFLVDTFKSGETLNKSLTDVYETARLIATHKGWDYSLQLQVLFNNYPKAFGKHRYSHVYSSFDIDIEHVQQIEPPRPPHIASSGVISRPELAAAERSQNSLPVVAVGGTFDHIHDGHKILLSMALFHASSTLIVGITGPKLLVNKKFAEVLESYETRELHVKTFFARLTKPELAVNCYEMNDICGPAGYIEDINGLVISQETVKGGQFVNNFRKEKGWKQLDIITIKVVGDHAEDDESFEGKISSTDIREQEYKKKQNLSR